jgi:hypothetical protein
MEIDVVLTDEPAPDAHEAILISLFRFNVERAGRMIGDRLRC